MALSPSLVDHTSAWVDFNGQHSLAGQRAVAAHGPDRGLRTTGSLVEWPQACPAQHRRLVRAAGGRPRDRRPDGGVERAKEVLAMLDGIVAHRRLPQHLWHATCARPFARATSLVQ